MEKFLKKTYSWIGKSLGFDDNSFYSLTGGGVGSSLSQNSSDAQLLANNKNWVFVCVHKIAQTCAGIELKLRKYNSKGEDEEMLDHAVLKLLYKPNRFQTGFDFFYTTYAHLLLTGNAYWLKNNPKNPTELMPLLPSYITLKYDNANPFEIKYEYRPSGSAKATTYSSEDIIHLKSPNPENIFKGKGKLSQIAEWIDIDSSATEFNRLFFKNGASPSGILETQATDEKGIMLAKVGFEQKYQGALNSHKTAVLPKGAKYTPSATPSDMQFSEADNRFRDKILSAFGVPKSVLGIVEDVNRANAEASNYVFMAFTIDPFIKQFIYYLDEMLLPSFSNTEKVYFDFDNIIPDNEDYELREKVSSLGGQSWKTINEIRSEEGLKPIDNGDYVYGGFSTIPIGKPQAESISNNDFKLKKKHIRIKDNTPQVEDITKSIFDKVGDRIASKMKASLEDEKHKEFIVRTTPYEKSFIESVKKVDAEMKKMVLENLDEEKAFGNIHTRKSLINTDKIESLFVGFSLNILQDLVKAEGQAQMEALNVSTPFNPMNESMQDKIKKLLKLTAQSYTNTTLQLLSNQLDEGISNGESLAKLTERVAEVFQLTDEFRASQVARTTVFGTANASAREAYKQSGVVKAVKWHTAEDELTCEFCEPMNGKIVDIDEGFFKLGDDIRGSSGGVMSASFNDIIDPPLHPNCRCFTLAETIEVNENTASVQETKEIKKEDEEESFLEKMLEILK